MKSENKVSRHFHGNFSCIGSSEAGQSNMSPMVGLQVVDIMMVAMVMKMATMIMMVTAMVMMITTMVMMMTAMILHVNSVFLSLQVAHCYCDNEPIQFIYDPLAAVCGHQQRNFFAKIMVLSPRQQF